MLFAFSLVLYLFGYLAFIYSILRRPVAVLSASTGLLLFMTVQYGPHTAIFTSALRNSIDISNEILNSTYNFVLGAAFFSLALVFIFSAQVRVSSLPKSVDWNKAVSTGGVGRVARGKLTFFVILLLAISVVLQPGLTITLEHLRVLMGQSFSSYTEVRRVLFADSIWASYANVVRFSILPVCFLYILLKASGVKSRAFKMLHYISAFLLLLIVAIQLNKFYFVYYGLLVLLFLFIKSSRRMPIFDWLRSGKIVLVFFCVSFVFVGGVTTLYKFQYSDALASGILDMDTIYDTFIFRVFFASSDSLRLWIDYFAFVDSPKGIAIIGKVCTFISSNSNDCFNANTYIPSRYLDRSLTTMQAGFLGTALGMFGIWSVPLFSLIVGRLVIFQNSVALSLIGNPIYFLYVPVSFLNSFFLTTRELHTALASGGVMLVPLFVLWLNRR